MEIAITYRRTSRLSLRIGKHGEVRVSAPYGYPKREIEHFIEERREWISNAQQRMKDQLAKRTDFFNQLPLSTRQQRQSATTRLNAIISPLIEKYSTLMAVHPSAISYRATISKWGSCTTRTRRLQFSTYLLLLPDWCIEHVVVHELAHLIVPNHSPQFYAVMNKFFPQWRAAREETKRISRMEVGE